VNATEAEAVRHLLRAALGERRAAATTTDAEHVADALAAAGLSPRQREVLQLVADGLTEAQIAGRLVVSYGTVKTHKADTFKRLGARSAAQAVAIAYRRGLIT
jgi:DNA-binding NarL/FixJ family response regulator